MTPDVTPSTPSFSVNTNTNYDSMLSVSSDSDTSADDLSWLSMTMFPSPMLPISSDVEIDTFVDTPSILAFQIEIDQSQFSEEG